MTRLTTATPINIRFMGSAICFRPISSLEGGGSPSISLGPYSWSRSPTSAVVRPSSRLVLKALTTASASTEYQCSMGAISVVMILLGRVDPRKPVCVRDF